MLCMSGALDEVVTDADLRRQLHDAFLNLRIGSAMIRRTLMTSVDALPKPSIKNRRSHALRPKAGY